MVRFVARKGLLPVIIPDLEDDMLESMLQSIDGFVMHGGSDVAPESYGEKPIGEWTGDRYRDIFDMKIINHAFKNNKPILAICRGCQILNVYFGGTLFQDISTQIGTTVKHHDDINYDTIYHDIAFTGKNVLFEMYKDYGTKMHVNSIHHQSVKTVGADMEILGISPLDGVVEAIRHKGVAPGKILGIQWHPEFNYKQEKKLLPADLLYDLFCSHL